MLLRNKDTHEEFHAPSGIAKALIATGTVEEVLSTADLGPEVTVEWSVSKGRAIEDYLCPPVISWWGGGNSGYHQSTDGTSHLKVKSYVPAAGRQQSCPKHIADEYLRLYAEWASKFKRRKPATTKETVSAHTPPVPGISPYAGATTSPWRHNLEFREKSKND